MSDKYVVGSTGPRSRTAHAVSASTAQYYRENPDLGSGGRARSLCGSLVEARTEAFEHGTGKCARCSQSLARQQRDYPDFLNRGDARMSQR